MSCSETPRHVGQGWESNQGPTSTPSRYPFSSFAHVLTQIFPFFHFSTRLIESADSIETYRCRNEYFWVLPQIREIVRNVLSWQEVSGEFPLLVVHICTDFLVSWLDSSESWLFVSCFNSASRGESASARGGQRSHCELQNNGRKQAISGLQKRAWTLCCRCFWTLWAANIQSEAARRFEPL